MQADEACRSRVELLADGVNDAGDIRLRRALESRDGCREIDYRIVVCPNESEDGGAGEI